MFCIAVYYSSKFFGLFQTCCLFHPQNYIEPIFLKRHEEQEKKLGRLEEGVQDINTELRKSMQVHLLCQSIAIGEPERQVRKALHCGNN